jgi:hypothetical protein
MNLQNISTASAGWIAAALVAVTPASAQPGQGAASCPAIPHAHATARSGPTTSALVELYTSEGCSSCPPADRQLSDLRRTLGADVQAIPLALHVNYWDAIGWRDPYAQDAFGERHSALVHANGHQIVYTPHFFINGVEQSQDAQAWRRTVKDLNAEPAQASLALDAVSSGSGGLRVVADVHATPERKAVLFLALAQNGLASQVTRGENRGSRLTHEHVVRSWIGPLALDKGSLHVERDLPLPAGADPAALEVVAFVSDGADGRVLQALQATLCDPTAKVVASGR